MKNRRNYHIDILYCSICGTKMFVPRSKGSQRECEHVKHMYCPKCHRRTAHVEQRYYDAPMQKEYYLRRPLKKIVIPNIKLFCSGEFWHNETKSIYVYVKNCVTKKIIGIYDWYNGWVYNSSLSKEAKQEIVGHLNNQEGYFKQIALAQYC